MCSCRVWVQLHTKNVDPAAARVHAGSDQLQSAVSATESAGPATTTESVVPSAESVDPAARGI